MKSIQQTIAGSDPMRELLAAVKSAGSGRAPGGAGVAGSTGAVEATGVSAR
jgi:hypothetical protein